MPKTQRSVWERLKRFWETAHQARFAYEILEWFGYDHPIKAAIIFLPTVIAAVLSVIGQLPGYGIALVVIGAFALSGLGVNAWDNARIKYRNKSGPLSILFEVTPHFVRSISVDHRNPDGTLSQIPTTQYIMGIHNNIDKTISDVQIAYECSDQEFLGALRRGLPFNTNIEIHPDTTANFSLITLYNIDGKCALSASGQDIKIISQMFTVRVFGRDARQVTAEFEYDPAKSPPISLVS